MTTLEASVPIIDEVPSLGPYDIYSETDHAAIRGLLTALDNQARLLHETVERGEPTPDEVGLSFRQLTLFHGSDTAGLTSLVPAKEHTFGYGLYATDIPRKAAGYALTHQRQEVEGEPTVYELRLSDVTLFDARNTQQRVEILVGFADALESEFDSDSPFGLSKAYYDHLHSEILSWDDKIPILIRDMRLGRSVHGTGNISHLNLALSAYLTSMGYDGLIIGEHEYLVGDHDSYVIFQPENVGIAREIPIPWFVKKDYEAINAAKLAVSEAAAQQKTNQVDGWFIG